MHTKKVRKLKKKPIIILISIILVIIAAIIAFQYIKYINSYEYKLKELGYNENDIAIIIKRKEEEIDKILVIKYNAYLPKLLKETYFLFNNLELYLEYYNENPDDDASHIISMVNVKANYDHYDSDIVTATDISKQNLILVNKFHYLAEDFVPENLISIKATYAYADNQIKQEVFDAFKNMWAAAKKEDLTLIINSSYRDYASQEYVWSIREATMGEEYADSIAARAGYSEHQTGLALDIITYGANGSNFEDTDEFKWLQKNAYKYGFILRYPKDKEDITGYAYESWHYRYVGIDAATEIHNKNITFDEYYAYYIGE